MKIADPNPVATKVCAVDGCDRPLRARGWCRMHYHRWFRTGSVGEASPRRIHANALATCAIKGCEEPLFGRGWCTKHYNQWRRQGDPLARIRNGDPWIMNGYRFFHRPEHPNATKTGAIAEHRIVMADHLGRPLASDEQIHHRNGDKLDNRIENLELKVGAHGNALEIEDAVVWALDVLRRYRPEVLANASG